jgi:penicillin-binding protein 2
LYDRGLLAQYPPGSPFKILTGLVALQENAINENTSVVCNHGFSFAPGRFMRCHCHGGVMQLHRGIYESCNTFFSTSYMRTLDKFSDPSIGVDVWSKHLKTFGLGQFMGYDLPTGRKGNIPTSKTYNKVYKGWRWSSKTIVSNAIGQGEVLMTPMQLANMMATVANRGFYFTPHIVRKIKGQIIDKKFTTKHKTTINRRYFETMISGLFDVYNFGTAHGLNVDGIDICGKTGTAENFTKVDGKRVQLKDHSIFVAFAPKDNPKIAIAILVENGGFGATIAGPIASLMIEKYIKHKITRKDLETRILAKDLQPEYNRFISKPIRDTLINTKVTIKEKAVVTIKDTSGIKKRTALKP